MARTQTQRRQQLQTQTKPGPDGTAIAVLDAPRLPYHPAIQERFEIDAASWKALVEAIYPSAKTTNAIIMALSYCRARKLDPFKRPVHIVPMWSSVEGREIETIWPGIAELRTTAFRTGQYAGKDETKFGPPIEKTFKATFTPRNGGSSETREVTVTFPEWCQVTLYRLMPNGMRVAFVGPKVYWLESYGRWKGTDVPNDMWGKRPFGQPEKCAEAGSLRCTFPEELGNQLTAEEMEGRFVDASALKDVTPKNDGPAPMPSAPPVPGAAPASAQAAPDDAGSPQASPAVTSSDDPAIPGSSPDQRDDSGLTQAGRTPGPDDDEQILPPVAERLADLEGQFAQCKTAAQVDGVWDQNEDWISGLTSAERTNAKSLYDTAKAKVGGGDAD